MESESFLQLSIESIYFAIPDLPNIAAFFNIYPIRWENSARRLDS